MMEFRGHVLALSSPVAEDFAAAFFLLLGLMAAAGMLYGHVTAWWVRRSARRVQRRWERDADRPWVAAAARRDVARQADLAGRGTGGDR